MSNESVTKFINELRSQSKFGYISVDKAKAIELETSQDGIVDKCEKLGLVVRRGTMYQVTK